MKPASVLPPDFLLVVAVTQSPLPVFCSKAQRPDYVTDDVFAIMEPHIINDETGQYYHHALVRMGSDLGKMFAQIAHDFLTISTKTHGCTTD